MSQKCQVCGPNKSEAPLIVCAPCAFRDLAAKARNSGYDFRKLDPRNTR